MSRMRHHYVGVPIQAKTWIRLRWTTNKVLTRKKEGEERRKGHSEQDGDCNVTLFVCCFQQSQFHVQLWLSWQLLRWTHSRPASHVQSLISEVKLTEFLLSLALPMWTAPKSKKLMTCLTVQIWQLKANKDVWFCSCGSVWHQQLCQVIL